MTDNKERDGEGNYSSRRLEDMNDDEIRKKYDDLNDASFQDLIRQEYYRRFGDTSEMVSKLRKQARTATETSRAITESAAQKGSAIGSKVLRRASDTVSQGVSSAKKMATSSEKNIELLERLAELHKKGILTDEEFQQKKKDLLAKI